jgi:hypothetical protein
MAVSHTPRKSQNKKKKVSPQQIDKVADLVSGYVKIWAKSEANRLLNTEQVPLIIPTKTGYKVGRFNVELHPGPCWIVTDYHGEKPLHFAEKRAAVLYCIHYQLRKFKQAEDVLLQDRTFAKLHNDFICYVHSIKMAVKRGDMFAVDVAIARRDETKHKLEVARNDLQKTLNQAKYIKIWDNQL